MQLLNKSVDKKKIMQYYKCLDSSGNGSISTDELVKLWLEGRELSDSSDTLFKLLERHLK